MPAVIDLTGGHYGRWTVLRRDHDEPRPGAWWVCLCDPIRGGCGREVTVRGQSLRDGESAQCRACAAAAGGHLGVYATSDRPAPTGKGRPSPRRGQPVSDATRERMRAGQRRRYGDRPIPPPRPPRPAPADATAVAAAVIDEGRRQTAVAAEHGLTRQRVSQIVQRERQRRAGASERAAGEGG